MALTITHPAIPGAAPDNGDTTKLGSTAYALPHILSGTADTADITNNAVTYAKIQNVSATDKVLGRSTAGAGAAEEIACTAAGRALIDDLDAQAQRNTLVLGTGDTVQFGGVGASSGTLTASAPAVNVAQTWNNAGVTFAGIKVNVTDTASAAASLLADFQVGGVSQTNIRKDGVVITLGSYRIGTTILSATNLSLQGDAILQREAAQTLAQRNGTNVQTWRLYNTYTDASNYERLSTVATAASDFKIIPEAAGTGTLRGIQLGVSAGKVGFYGTTAVTKPTALTAADAATVDATYGSEEAGVIANLRTRLAELETKLQSLGLLA